jgi:T5SS/PEP-CTERM-associated repeat protein/autotransporter-associated beta strand protein
VGKDGKGTLIVDDSASVTSGGGVVGLTSAVPSVASIAGSSSSWNMGANQLIVGAEGAGTLEISAGATVTNGPAIIGRDAAGTGTVVLEQPGTTWTSSGLVNIGLNGNGLLQVSGGAQVSGTSAVVGGDPVSSAAGSGAVALSGVNSTWNLSSQLIVGGGGIGSVSLDGGARLTSASAIVGDGAGSTGIVDLTDAGTSWTNAGTMRVGNNGSGDVTIGGDASATSGPLDIGINAVGNVAVSGPGSTWTSSGPIRVGIAHFGTLLIDAGGAMNDPSATVGSAAGGIGQVIVRGAASTWSTTGTLNVGRGGADGVVSIENGGQATSGPSNIGGDGASLSGNGAVIVKGAGSHWTATAITLGLGGSGDIEALSGGVIDAVSLVISNGPVSSLGIAKVQDTGSKLNVTGTIEVGRDVNGTLDVSNGGLVTSAGGAIGILPSATGTAAISGSGSRWTLGGDLDLAVNGAGALNVSGGGSVGAVNAFVGRGPSGSGTATISGASSQWTLSDSLYIGGDDLGPQGSGLVNVASSATVAATNQIKIWATGTLDLNNGNVTTALVDLQGGLISGNGTLASPVSSTNGRVSTNATIALTAPLSIVAGSNLTKQGTGTLRIDGPQNHGTAATLNIAGGALQLNTDAGAPATAADAASANLIVRVSGSSVSLGANQELMGLNVEFANPLSQSFDLATPPTPGAFRAVRVYPVDLVTAKGALYAAIRNANTAGAPDPTDGIFDSGLPAHPNSKLGMARLTDLHGDPYILIRPTRIGDLNLDGQVTISDFIDLASNFNSVGATWQEGDLNYDGSVTISDFIDLASNFNASYSGQIFPISPEDQQTLATFASSIGAAVPEPGSAVFTLGIGATLLATRRRRR